MTPTPRGVAAPLRRTRSAFFISDSNDSGRAMAIWGGVHRLIACGEFARSALRCEASEERPGIGLETVDVIAALLHDQRRQVQRADRATKPAEALGGHGH